MKGGHRSSRSGSKVSYSTEQAAIEAARRRHSMGWSMRVYECKDRRREAPGVPWPHWHLTSVIPRITSQTEGYRFHEEFNDVLGSRVVGCLLMENGPKALRAIRQRAEKALRRLMKEQAA